MSLDLITKQVQYLSELHKLQGTLARLPQCKLREALSDAIKKEMDKANVSDDNLAKPSAASRFGRREV